MTIVQQTMQLARQVATQIDIPSVTSIHLPTPVEDVEKADEFGFIFLSDGSTGPFYTSLDDTLHQLWQRYPDGKTLQADTLGLTQQLDAPDLASRAIALGAYNAMSQHVMRLAGYSPVSTHASSIGISQPQAGETVGMVGYFCPLIERFLEQDIQVLVLEKNPDRVVIEPGVSLTTDVSDLAECAHVLCTASTLVNGTLDEILQHCSPDAVFSLAGPSGSGLPDVLFQNGIDAVGGILFDDLETLLQVLAVQESWGHAGQKYQLTADNYPGIEELLTMIAQRQTDVIKG